MKNVYLIGISCVFIAIFADGMLSFSLEFACEASHPVPPNRASGVVLAYSHLLSTIIILCASYIIPDPNDVSYDNSNSILVCMLFASCFFIAFLCIHFAKEDLRKTRIDLEENVEKDTTI